MQGARDNSEERRGKARGCGALAVGLALGLLAAEVLLRALIAPTTLLDPAHDDYWRAHFRALPELAADIEHDAQLGWRMRRGFRAEGVSHDADGHRVTPRIGASAADKRCVVFLGDSFTYGLGVRDEETYAARFGAASPGREVFNLAANGHGLDQQVLAFEAEGVARNPSLVVVGYFVDDFRRNGLAFREAQKPHFELEHGRLRLVGPPIPPPAEVRATLESWSEPRLFTWAALNTFWTRVRHTRGAFAGDADFEQHAQLSSSLLARLKQTTDALGARLIVLVIPHCTYDGYLESARIETAIEAACSALAIPCLALREPLREAEGQGRVMFGPNCHWSAAGHALAAERLVERLAALGIER